jgi:hypothetical protein
MKRAGSGGNSSQSSTSDSDEDFLLDMLMWDDWMGSDSEFLFATLYQIMYFKIGVTFKK